MELLKVPTKYKRCGIKIKCLKCKFQVSVTCKQTGKNIGSCQFKEKHRFNLVVHVPHTKTSRKMKLLNTKIFESALIEMVKFKEELKRTSFQKKNYSLREDVSTTLIILVSEYLDMISGVNTPKHLIRLRSKSHIQECQRVLSRFAHILTTNGYNPEILKLEDVKSLEVEMFHNYLIDILKLGNASYNKHFVIMKTFFNWVIENKGCKITNPFAHAELTFTRKQKTIITKDEFDNLLKVLRFENGWGRQGTENKNFYKPWLSDAFTLALETGTRAEELVNLKWNNIVQLEKKVLVLSINNLKVNRIQSGTDHGKYMRYIPMTKSLLKLLDAMGLADRKGTDEFILDRRGRAEAKYMMTSISRGFSHFIKQATGKKIEFKDLRKTYITRLALRLGDKAILFTGHSNYEILKNHYLSSAHLAGQLNDFEIFE